MTRAAFGLSLSTGTSFNLGTGGSIPAIAPKRAGSSL